jgi:heat shock protein HslJ
MRSAASLLASLAVLLDAACGGDGSGGGAGEATFEGRPWVLVSGVGLPADAAAFGPSATFAAGRVGGSTGCNRFTSTYTVEGESLDIGQIASTQMACPPPADRVERSYLAALERVAGWRMDGEQLVLSDPEDADLLRYASATPVGSWQVTGLLEGDALVSPILGTDLTATFGSDGSLTGSAGCNSYHATYTSDEGAIEVQAPAGTKKACAEPAGVMEQEAAYLSALPTAVGYHVDGTVLELLSADGKRLVTYTRAKGK